MGLSKDNDWQKKLTVQFLAIFFFPFFFFQWGMMSHLFFWWSSWQAQVDHDHCDLTCSWYILSDNKHKISGFLPIEIPRVMRLLFCIHCSYSLSISQLAMFQSKKNWCPSRINKHVSLKIVIINILSCLVGSELNDMLFFNTGDAKLDCDETLFRRL